jgi:Uma2 family endonuclease
MAATAVLTSERFLAMPDEFDDSGNEVKRELIAGELVDMPTPSLLHEMIRANILATLMSFVRSNRQLNLWVVPNPGVVATDHDTFIPDASVIARHRLEPGEKRCIMGAPDLAVEVVSPSETATRLKHKVDTYLSSGSQTVWVFFPTSQSVMIHTSDSVREVKTGQFLEDSLLPGFSAPVSSFFDLT